MRLFLLLAACTAALPAAAQQRPASDPITVNAPGAQPQATVIAEPVALLIAGFDSDGDARVTRAEFDAGLKRSFDSADTGHTGSLGYIAYSDWSLRWMGDRNTLPSPFEMDRDGDNKVSWSEFQDRFAQIWTRFDKNKDGVIERSELVTIRPPAFNPMDGKRKRR
ncbi:EF-hand domain-containing protein [Sphingomonas sp. ABOLD]|uniref:Opacity protein-like surface antigen n=1 Tax=Sphingomonas trueperi TaxID=53317 RepID=A0A7X6BC93_9SPHN|nr:MULTISPECIES: EF-hand domain-containing protein [Sphingomonas]NJB96407.1 opacity protein-like surface antigen [Sphingomonas trueperi]RSV37370.1 EF-hand domain-containing protein [Sphingomonas sp. ABOLD]RSV39861.1 EF-hand domain-containing protein [Sphingomonas sp. ABOLE]